LPGYDVPTAKNRFILLPPRSRPLFFYELAEAFMQYCLDQKLAHAKLWRIQSNPYKNSIWTFL
jgi:hypothetical protein